MGIIEKAGETAMDPAEYRKRRNEIPDMFVELSLGLVRVEPEGGKDFYELMESMGMIMDTPENMDITHDDNGNVRPGKLMEMKLDMKAMMKNIDDVTMKRCCAITREPIIKPTPGPDDKRSDEYLYWDELHPKDRKTLELALADDRISASGKKFRPEEPHVDPDSDNE